jgi:hypothetical protein
MLDAPHYRICDAAWYNFPCDRGIDTLYRGMGKITWGNTTQCYDESDDVRMFSLLMLARRHQQGRQGRNVTIDRGAVLVVVEW